MRPSVVVEGARVFLGDCRDVLKSLPDNSVDSVVTDPPYELGFMGKSWDNSGIAYDVTVWEECLRVLKPGGHILAFGGSRTWHRLAVAIEDAGFEIRDNIAWIYGSGFPKSLDVSKAIDKRRDDDSEGVHRVVRWLEDKRKASGVTRREVETHFGTENIGQSIFTITPGSASRVPTLDQWAQLKVLFDFDNSMDAEVWRLNGRKGKPGENWDKREVIGQGTSGKTAIWNEAGKMGNFDLTAPATSEAEKWQGWGTALKPAFEPVVVGRKPIQRTVAENVLAWGVGGLNIDGSRIGNDKRTHGWAGRSQSFTQERTETRAGMFAGNGEGHTAAQGRWPANVVLDEFTAGLLDEQSGVSVSNCRKSYPATEAGTGWGTIGSGGGSRGQTDSGGASRFFYQAKASRRDRNEGLEDLEAKRHADRVVDDGPGGENPRNRTNQAKQNFHPTVKPTALMRYLIKLVTPEGGTVLDPFTGSGSTGKAALLDGYEFIGAELTEEYLPIIEGRLRWAVENRDEDGTLF